MKVAQDIDLDDKTVRLTTDKKITVDYSHNTGVMLDKDNVTGTIQYARDNAISIVDMRKQTVNVTENISFRHLNVLLPNTTFVVQQKDDGSFPYIEMGGNSNTTDNPYQELGTIRRSTFNHRDLDPTKLLDHPSVIILGAKNQSIKLKQVDYLRLELREDAQSNSIAYSNFDINFVQRLEITPNAANMGTPELWCNENLFNVRRLYGLDMHGHYHHNNNLFVGASVDYKGSYLNIQQGKNNRFVNFRLEEVAKITFGERTEFNTLEITWYSSLPKILDIGAKPYVIDDKGRFNKISKMPERYFEKYRVGYKTGPEGTLVAGGAWQPVYTSPKFEYKPKEDFLVFDWDNPNARYLVTVTCFDKAGEIVVPTQFTSPFLTVNAAAKRLQGNYQGGQKYGTRYIWIDDPNVESVQVSFNSNSNLAQSLSTKFICDLYANGPRMTNIV